MWDLPRPGLEPVSPALAGRFSTTVQPGKPLFHFLNQETFIEPTMCQALGNSDEKELVPVLINSYSTNNPELYNHYLLNIYYVLFASEILSKAIFWGFYCHYRKGDSLSEVSKLAQSWEIILFYFGNFQTYRKVERILQGWKPFGNILDSWGISPPNYVSVKDHALLWLSCFFSLFPLI